MLLGTYIPWRHFLRCSDGHSTNTKIDRLKSSIPSMCYLNCYKDKKTFNLFHNKTILLLIFSSNQHRLLLVLVWCFNISVRKHNFKCKFGKDCF